MDDGRETFPAITREYAMSDIVAVWDRSEQQIDPDTITKMLTAEVNPKSDGKDTWLKDSVALGRQHFWVTPEEVGERQPLVDANSGCVLASNARLDNREELICMLGKDNRVSDAQLILGAYIRWGEDSPAYLLGDFAFIVWDPNRKQLFAARDALGAVDLVYLLTNSVVILAGTINTLLSYPAHQIELCEEMVFKYLALNRADEESTYYKDIYHLPPAHWLLVKHDGMRLQRYWDVEPGKKIRYRDPGEYAVHFRELISGSIKAHTRSIHPFAISLSGGLDSSALTCLTAEMMPSLRPDQQELWTYSYVFEDLAECDEREYIQAVVEKTSARNPVRKAYVSGDRLYPAPLAKEWPVSRECPDQDPYILLIHALLERAAGEGVRSMLNGFCGDDLYSGDQYLLVDDLAEGRIAEVIHLLRQDPTQWDRLRNYGLRALVPSRLKKWYRGIFPSTEWKGWMGSGFARRVGLEKLDNSMHAFPKFIAAGVQQRYHGLFYSGYAAGVAAYQRIAKQFGMKYEFPYFNRGIIEFVLAIPSGQVNGPACQRKLLRDALQGRLPEVVRKRPDKTMLLQLYDKGVYQESWGLIQAFLKNAQVVQRGWVDRDWLAREVQGSVRTHDGYILWLVLCLEIWLQRYWA